MRIVLSFLLVVSVSAATATVSGCGFPRETRMEPIEPVAPPPQTGGDKPRTAERHAGAPASSVAR